MLPHKIFSSDLYRRRYLLTNFRFLKNICKISRFCLLFNIFYNNCTNLLEKSDLYKNNPSHEFKWHLSENTSMKSLEIIAALLILNKVHHNALFVSKKILKMITSRKAEKFSQKILSTSNYWQIQCFENQHQMVQQNSFVFCQLNPLPLL